MVTQAVHPVFFDGGTVSALVSAVAAQAAVLRDWSAAWPTVPQVTSPPFQCRCGTWCWPPATSDGSAGVRAGQHVGAPASAQNVGLSAVVEEQNAGNRLLRCLSAAVEADADVERGPTAAAAEAGPSVSAAPRDASLGAACRQAIDAVDAAAADQWGSGGSGLAAAGRALAEAGVEASCGGWRRGCGLARRAQPVGPPIVTVRNSFAALGDAEAEDCEGGSDGPRADDVVAFNVAFGAGEAEAGGPRAEHAVTSSGAIGGRAAACDGNGGVVQAARCIAASGGAVAAAADGRGKLGLRAAHAAAFSGAIAGGTAGCGSGGTGGDAEAEGCESGSGGPCAEDVVAFNAVLGAGGTDGGGSDDLRDEHAVASSGAIGDGRGRVGWRAEHAVALSDAIAGGTAGCGSGGFGAGGCGALEGAVGLDAGCVQAAGREEADGSVAGEPLALAHVHGSMTEAVRGGVAFTGAVEGGTEGCGSGGLRAGDAVAVNGAIGAGGADGRGREVPSAEHVVTSSGAVTGSGCGTGCPRADYAVAFSGAVFGGAHGCAAASSRAKVGIALEGAVGVEADGAGVTEGGTDAAGGAEADGSAAGDPLEHVYEPVALRGGCVALDEATGGGAEGCGSDGLRAEGAVASCEAQSTLEAALEFLRTQSADEKHPSAAALIEVGQLLSSRAAGGGPLPTSDECLFLSQLAGIQGRWRSSKGHETWTVIGMTATGSGHARPFELGQCGSGVRWGTGDIALSSDFRAGTRRAIWRRCYGKGDVAFSWTHLRLGDQQL